MIIDYFKTKLILIKKNKLNQMIKHFNLPSKIEAYKNQRFLCMEKLKIFPVTKLRFVNIQKPGVFERF